MQSAFVTTNLAASSKSANLLSGDINEFVAQRSLVNVYAVSSASGIRLSMLADSDVAVDDKEIVAIGTTLNKDQHLIDSFAVEAGTRLSATLRETAAVATTDILTAFEIVPV